MSYLSTLYLPGALTLWCATFFALATLWGYAQLLRGDETARAFARRAYRFFALSLVLASVVLVILLLRRDFRSEYVYQYTGLELPAHYQFAAFWAGQKGSFLIWLLWGALLGIPLARAARKEEAPVMGIYTLTLVGILFILVRENPFLMLTETPTDGAGLNPLLQDDWMVIHPPIMFVGYALSAVPFAFAMAALWRRETDRWAARAFPWALAGFLVLGTAILLGGYWAYKTLGWGGYWGWDPVENASLIPWVFDAALIHGLYMERTRRRFRRANFALAALVYLSVLYGTFLTRSGVLADFSVHSFVDLGISGWLLAGMGFWLLTSIYLLATRLPGVETARNEDPLLSRGAFLVLATITMVIAALVITAGTSAPLLTRFLDNPGQVGPEFYNRVNLPIALFVSLLVALVPYLGWKGERPRALARRLALPAAGAAVAAVVALVAGVREPFHLAFIALAALALASNLQKVVELGRARGLRAAGGYLAHVGVGSMFLGFIASSAYDTSTKVTLEQGAPQQVEDLTLTFTRFLPRTAEEKERMEIEVKRADGSTYFAYPRFFLNDRTRQLMVNPDIRKLALHDLYISPIEFDPGEPVGALRRVQLGRGQAARFGDLEVRFVDFDLNAEGNALAQMESGGVVTVGAVVDLLRDGSAERRTALYRFRSDGQVETPPVSLPGGGTLVVSALSAATSAVQLDIRGVGSATAGSPPKLAVDVTRKPLIKLVWYGLWVVLAGGIVAMSQRLLYALSLDRV